MVKLFVKLILLGRKTIDDVPCKLQPEVSELLEENEQNQAAQID